MPEIARTYAVSPTRVQLQNKDRRGWAEFAAQLAEHSALGSSLTMRGVQARRPSLYDLQDRMAALKVPTLVLTGDEDEPCLDVALLLKRRISTSALAILPRTGHALNLEEPALFNQLVGDFFHQVEAGRWGERDPRALSASILGLR